MTHDDMIAVIQADKEGKSIEWRNKGASVWCDVPSKALWDFFSYEYRIKPEPKKPREWILAVDENGNVAGAGDNIGPGSIVRITFDAAKRKEEWTTILVREVLE